jgi:hypothetical protein
MSFGEWIWWLIIVFFMVIFFMMLFRIVIDVFRNHESSGWVKAGWLLLLLWVPLLGMLIYVIVNGKAMAQRDVKQYEAMASAQQDYIRSVAGAGASDSAAQIEKAHDLLTKGAISQAEFDALKAKALAA